MLNTIGNNVTPKTLQGIRNFQKIDEHLSYGESPTFEQLKELKNQGVHKIINFRRSPHNNEKEVVEGLGMKYFNLPFHPNKNPSKELINKFFNITEGAGKTFMHGYSKRRTSLFAFYIS